MPCFRARIFGVTALIVALVLASVALFSWSSVLAFEGQRLDERLTADHAGCAIKVTTARHAVDV